MRQTRTSLSGSRLQILVCYFWWYHDVCHQIYQCQNLHPLVALPLSVIYSPLTPPLIKCCEFPRYDPFFETILKLSLFRHAALYSFQVAFECKAMIRPLCFCIRQPSQQYQADHLIISLVKISLYCAQISSATSQQECIFVLHICLRQTFRKIYCYIRYDLFQAYLC